MFADTLGAIGVTRLFFSVYYIWKDKSLTPAPG
jgi:hypothetical protein